MYILLHTELYYTYSIIQVRWVVLDDMATASVEQPALTSFFSIDSLRVQTLMLTYVKSPFLGTPIVPFNFPFPVRSRTSAVGKGSRKVCASGHAHVNKRADMTQSSTYRRAKQSQVHIGGALKFARIPMRATRFPLRVVL